MPTFDPDRFFVTTDSELSLLGSPAALAQWRHRGEGPRYHRVGRRILYLGRDLNRYLDQCAIEPTVRRDASKGSASSPAAVSALPSSPDGSCRGPALPGSEAASAVTSV